MTTQASHSDSDIDRAIHRVRGGDTAAFEVLVRRFERPLRAWLAVQALPGIDVDEVAQRAFVASFTRIESFEPGSDFGAWLFTIARFQLKSEATRLRRIADYHSRYAPDLLERELQRRSETPEFQEARLDQLRSCMDLLSAPLRRFISWRYDEGIPLEEMSSRSGRSVSAVKKQLWLLRRTLHECIEKQTENRRPVIGGESS